MSKQIKYQPIDCNLHSYLEHFATKKEQVKISFKNAGETKMIEGVIIDIQTIKGEEFIIIEKSSKSIRLDKIVKVNQIDFSGSSSCGIH